MFKNFEGFKNLKYGISEKSDGAMELAEAVLNGVENRRKFFSRRGIENSQTISPAQTHSDKVVKVGESHPGKKNFNADGLVTAAYDLFLTVTVADCFPIYFYNPASNIIGLAHSGWRGTAGNIAEQVIKCISGNPANLIAALGSGIGPCHFEIQKDILPKFAKYPEAIQHRNNKIHVDLPAIITRQLLAAGLKSQNIENCGECTFCLKEKYFSYRRDKPKNVEAMVAYIGLKM
jgi:YfiH family protein